MNKTLQAHNRAIMLNHVKQITMSHAQRSINVIQNAIANGYPAITGQEQIVAIKGLK